eukprot:m.717895 g.717895  ORF g.717895 m.717895 type:complete len:145 (-) comp22989_c0_seq10:1207-1641(-)
MFTQIEEILRLALRAPSGGNTQPWHIHVVSDRTKDKLCDAAVAYVASGKTHKEEFPIYPPKEASAEYMDRRRKLGHQMFDLMGIKRSDKVARTEAMLRNFKFFGAPVGLIVAVDRIVASNGWGHVGHLVQYVPTKPLASFYRLA